ncbi:BTAD domain-containing putative transcriptional regulator [Nisaea sp.]|uniref:BTAD domain-containing putative transcriptional regulator n=1 Tax=Nisaea sp. TaxID=2024842 RepID=UPI003B52AD95
MTETEMMQDSKNGDAVTLSRILDISLVAETSALIGNQRLDLRRRKLAALLGYLALSEARSATRERLVGLLWSETQEGNARTSLRQILHWLRRALEECGYEGLRVDKHKVSLGPESVVVDVWEAVEAAERKTVHQKLLDVGDFSGRLLDGFEDIDPAFRIWLLARRQSIHERLLRALEEILADGNCAEAERARAAEAILNLDPTNEDAVRHLMWLRAVSGNIGAALKIYKALWDILDEDFAMEPSVKTQELVAEIKSGMFDEAPPAKLPVAGPGQGMPDPQVSAGQVAQRLVIAVEPFSVDAIHPDQHHLLMGFRHFLVGSFVRFREWRLMDLQAPLAAGESPEVRFVLQATVLGPGDPPNVVLTLKDVNSGFYVWSDRFALRLDDLVTLQQRVVRSITAALNIHLSVGRMVWPADGSSIPSHLYDTWLRGQAMVARYDPADWRRASQLFENVIQQAPDFAPAYSSLVQLKNSQHIVHPGTYRNDERQAEALSLARTAARLDPIDSRTQLCLAWANAFDEQYEPAELHFDLARELNDLDPWTLTSVAQGFAFLGMESKAEKFAAAGLANCVEPKPLHWSFLAGIRFFTGDYEGTYDAAVRAGDFVAANGSWRAAALARLGRLEEAQRERSACLTEIRRRWKGDRDPDDGEITRWILQLFPVREPHHRDILRTCLDEAGFPVE